MAEQSTAQRERLAAAYGAAQRRAVMQTLLTTQRLWARLSTDDLTGSWVAGLGAAMVRALSAGQLLAASSAQPFVDAVVHADGLVSDYEHQASRVQPRQLSGVAADGRSLDSLMYLPVIRTKTLLKGGLSVQESMLAGQADMQRIVVSEVADAGSGAAGVAMVANRTVTGYLRTVRAGACSRCLILAGRWYRWSADFERHKHCQCYGVPSTRVRGRTPQSPMSLFSGLSRAEQDRRFGAADAQAIRDGADIYQVVNARRGMTTVDAFGKRYLATLEGTSRQGAYYRLMREEAERKAGQRFARGVADTERGLPQFRLRTPRLMPAEIYRLYRERDEIIRQLRRFNYLL